MTGTVFITGVSSGLGLALAEYYLESGATVLGCSRRLPAGLAGRDRFRHVAVDLADFAEVPGRLELLFPSVTRCDLAILNAGILSPYGDLQSVSVADCQQVLDVNLWANKVLIDWLIAHIPELKQVVTISSGAGINGNRGWNAYAISKAALNMLTHLYAQECPATYFLAVAPGPVDTAMQDHLCQLPADSRFPTLDSLRKRRHTPEMPAPETLAPRLAELFAAAPAHLASGAYVDIRKPSW